MSSSKSFSGKQNFIDALKLNIDIQSAFYFKKINSQHYVGARVDNEGLDEDLLTSMLFILSDACEDEWNKNELAYSSIFARSYAPINGGTIWFPKITVNHNTTKINGATNILLPGEIEYGSFKITILDNVELVDKLPWYFYKRNIDRNEDPDRRKLTHTSYIDIIPYISILDPIENTPTVELERIVDEQNKLLKENKLPQFMHLRQEAWYDRLRKNIANVEGQLYK